ncbi:UNVERIFIED_CONTAM: Retrovirus-related Pol polyprotein from transposon TNT 1-94 [Sesamum angustifolium]|uniref:Retrovirus-related Pol polyprotein from transposon TNT 1-94 n=1 Tax=Sesamum angustifolium TaxID=2727405 RepID=A0AAW2PR89_9LAMI
MANQKRCDIQGLGDVCLTFSDGYKLTLRNVRYVPDLNHNLMSCAALKEEGLEGRWGKGIMKIMKGSLTVFKADRREICIIKFSFLLHKNPNPVSSSSILDYVHADVWGPSNVSTHGENGILVENQTGKKLKVLRTDNGLEFCHAVDISSLRVFGCSAFVHQSVDKLAPRSQKCVFIGYPDGIKGYRLWLRSQPGFKVLISKDVIFNENEMPCLDDSQDKNNDNLDLTFNKVEDNQQGEENEEEPRTDFLENSNSEGLDDYLLARDRNRREPRIPARYNDFHIALNVEPNEPSSVEEALKSENSKNWLSAMAEEMKSLKDNNTWVLVPKPKSCSVVNCKWIFKIKEEDTSKDLKLDL